MLRSMKDFIGYEVQATDGEIGQVDDFLFDDHSWDVRYLVVATGIWLAKRRVLVSPVALGSPKGEVKSFPVMLTRDQVKVSPVIDTDQPVSRQMEEELHTYYRWSPYWSDTRGRAAARVISRKIGEGAMEDLTLRSVGEVVGYDIHATDGEIGRVEDFIADDQAWVIRYLVVDTHRWLPGRKVLVAPTWVDMVNWSERNVYVGLPWETVKDSPEYDPSAPVNSEYELRLYDYYGRPRYWIPAKREGSHA